VSRMRKEKSQTFAPRAARGCFEVKSRSRRSRKLRCHYAKVSNWPYLREKSLSFLMNHIGSLRFFRHRLPENFTITPFHAYVARRFNGVIM
jgi:hypothetical protein